MDVDPVALRRSAGACALAAVLLLCCGRCAAGLRCLFCPLQARGGRCGNVSTECAPGERCFSGWRRYGPVRVLAVQGCASADLCGSNRTVSLRGSEIEISYTCCCRDRCNTAPGSRRREPTEPTDSPSDAEHTHTHTHTPELR